MPHSHFSSSGIFAQYSFYIKSWATDRGKLLYGRPLRPLDANFQLAELLLVIGHHVVQQNRKSFGGKRA
jgi:hypothetical protein